MTTSKYQSLDATLVDHDDAPAPTAPPGLSRTSVLPRDRTGGTAPAIASDTPRYEQLRVLGRGGVGEVTLAIDRDIERPVAVKRLRPDRVSAPVIQRFIDEIRTVGQLEHPNIAPVHDVGIDDAGQHYFVMRYIAGETLEAIIAKLASGDLAYHARYTFEYRVQVFLGVLNAIHFAHGKGIIHRDIKPSNIMVGPYGEVVVMDWGIAKKIGAPEHAPGDAPGAEPIGTADTAHGGHAARRNDVTAAGTLIGTPAYMSPEQARGHTEVDVRSDVYSLSAMFYELLTLQHYLPSQPTVYALLDAVLNEPPKMAAMLRSPLQPNVPVELSWYLHRGLAKDPAARFQSLAEMVSDLHHAIAGDFAVRCHITLLKRTNTRGLRFVDAHPHLAVAAVVTVAAITLFGLVELVGKLL